MRRQIESMAASSAAQQAAHAAAERHLVERLREAEEAARAATESERTLKVRHLHAPSLALLMSNNLVPASYRATPFKTPHLIRDVRQ